MPGRPRTRLRRQALEAAQEAAKLVAAGDPGAAEAVEKAGRLAALARGEPGLNDNSERWGTPPAPKPRRLPEPRMAASAHVPPAPLSEEEFANSSGILSACAGTPPANPAECGPGEMADWLAAAMPVLTEDERVRAARYLSALADAPLRPDSERRSASDSAMVAACLPYTAFEAMCKRESQFAAACGVLTDARRRAVMNMLEETLMERAFDGQVEQQATRDGGTAEIRKFDNRLAFDMLRYNHDHYEAALGGGKQRGAGAGGGGMTLMIAGGAVSVPQKRIPKTVEVSS